jgi:hypothetical protein
MHMFGTPTRGALRALAVVSAVAGTIAACGTGADDATTGVTAGQTGMLLVQLTDAPFPFDSVKSVDVFVVRVDAKTTATDSAEAAKDADDAGKDRGGWTTIAEPKAKIDLLTLRDGKTTNLGQKAVPAASYKGFRLVIDPAQSSVTLKNGTVLTATSNPGIQFPSAAQSGIKVNLDRDVRVGKDSTSAMVIDFDVAQSFQMRGPAMKNGLMFTPVLKATVK